MTGGIPPVISHLTIMAFRKLLTCDSAKQSSQNIRTGNDLFLLAASISRRKRVMLKNARFNPENMADCEIQKRIPIQITINVILKIPLADPINALTMICPV
jgi:hypothetical protein